MSKDLKKKTPASKHTKEEKPIIPEEYQHYAAVGLVFLLLVLFFSPVIFGDKTFLDADTIASHSFDTFVGDANKDDIFPLWNPYIFCGMPAYGSLTVGGARFFDISALIFNRIISLFHLLMLSSPIGWVLFYYFVFAAGIYLLAYSKTNSKVGALVASIGATFSMFIIIWVMVGHNTKISVMAFFPFTFYLIERLRMKFEPMSAVTLVLLLHFSFQPSHVQMIFYTFLTLGIYFLYTLVRQILKKENLKGTIRAGVILAIASVLAFAMDADKYLSVLEYNPYSIRGNPPITQTVQTAQQTHREGATEKGGLDYDYATSWSFAPGEIITFFVPSWYGFGYHTYKGDLTQGKEFLINTYWGTMPFTHAPQYMGIVVLLLAIIGFIKNRKDFFVQYMMVVIVFSLFVSFGREFPLIFDLMFKYFPFFNKFRIPSMILVLVQIFIPILAAYGTASLLAGRTEGLSASSEKKWKYSLFGLVGIFILAIVVRGLFEGIYSSFAPFQKVGGHLMRALQNNDQRVLQEFYQFLVNTVMTDIYFAIAFTIIILGSFYAYLKGTIKLTAVSVIVILVVTVDLWRIDKKPMEPKNRQEQKQLFTTPDYVSAIKQDTSLYRVLKFENGQLPYDNTLAYWKVQSAYGYQGAKMRWYQDMIDVAGVGNPLLWQLMNVKYIISDRPESSQVFIPYFKGSRNVYQAATYIPRAFFVDHYEIASGIDILNKIARFEFDPKEVGFFIDDPKLTIEPPKPGAEAIFTKYGIQDFAMNVTATGNNLLFISETYYPEGWKAYVDGNEIPIYRINYLFRSVVIPAGKHVLEMKFEPRGFYLGKTISLIVNILVLLGLITLLIVKYRSKANQVSEAV